MNGGGANRATDASAFKARIEPNFGVAMPAEDLDFEGEDARRQNRETFRVFAGRNNARRNGHEVEAAPTFRQLGGQAGGCFESSPANDAVETEEVHDFCRAAKKAGKKSFTRLTNGDWHTITSGQGEFGPQYIAV